MLFLNIRCGTQKKLGFFPQRIIHFSSIDIKGEHSAISEYAILSTFIKLPFVIKISVLSIYSVAVLHKVLLCMLLMNKLNTGVTCILT